jgi:hypothetical protein
MGLNSSSSSNTNIRRSPADNSHIIAMMSQLKKVNDWLDWMNSGRDGTSDPEFTDSKDRLKHKIYGFLLQHMESATSASGNVLAVGCHAKIFLSTKSSLCSS